MPRNKIYAIVEGKGEANKPLSGESSAVHSLIGRMLNELGCWTLFPQSKRPPFRLPYTQFFPVNLANPKFEAAIRHHKRYDDCAAILVLLDMDDDCPMERAQQLTDRVLQMESLPFSIVVVCAKCEYEAWFLASLESIHEDQSYSGEPEAIRDAKGWLRRQFGYKPTRHQAAYTRKLDFLLAYERSRSFRRLYNAFEQIIEAVDQDMVVITPKISVS